APELRRRRRRAGGHAGPPWALHTTRRTARLVTERADYVFVVKGNASETFGILDTIDWERDAAGSFAEDLDKVHGRLEQRSISVLTPPKGLVNYPGVSQIARVTRCREPLKKGPDDTGKGERDYTETVCLITSLDAGAASPEELRRLNRGHWAVENLNHRQRLRLRRGRLPDPHGQRPGEPGHARQHRARGDLRQPPRSGEPGRTGAGCSWTAARRPPP
ncbi:MAG: hypothetical protein OXH79_11360, partial [Boseongicola sp.]|nr:hypothetical protein [Boseongicola sp.]